MGESVFPEVQPGGSLILAWQVKNKRVLMIGGGEVAAGRVLNLLNADAYITILCPTSGLNPEVAHRIRTNPTRIKHINKPFLPTILDDPDIAMVMCAIDDPTASSQVYKACQARRIPSNIADVPPECDFYFGSTHRDGPLQIMVSTNGNGPRMAAQVRRQIASSLPSNIGMAIQKVGELRRGLRKVAPGSGGPEGAKRMRWMSKVCDEWSLEEICEMDERDMSTLLGFYQKEEVPTFERVRCGEESVFDGSFGWACVV